MNSPLHAAMIFWKEGRDTPMRGRRGKVPTGACMADYARAREFATVLVYI